MISSLSLALRFLIAELGALAAFAWWGLDRGGFSIVLGLGAAALVVLLWGAFVGPRAPRRLADPARLVLELVIFAGATAALVDIGHPVVAAVFAVVAVVTTGLVRVWPEPVQPVR